MTNSTSYLAYPDIRDAFERALKGPIKLTFKDRKAAFRFVGRANSYRYLDRKESKKLYEPSHTMYERSPYDVLHIARVDNIVTIKVLKLSAAIEELDE